MARRSDRPDTELWKYMDEWAKNTYGFSLAQAQWATLLNLSDSAISDWKLGKVVPEREHLRYASKVTTMEYERLNALADLIAQAKAAKDVTPERAGAVGPAAQELLDPSKKGQRTKPSKTGTEGP